jgi:MFS family permease
MWMQPLLLNDLLNYPHITKTLAGAVLGVEVAALSISSALCARFVRKTTYRALALMGVGLALLANVVCLEIHDLALLMGARALCGVGEGAALMVSYSALSGAPDPDRAYAYVTLWSTPIASIAMYLAPMVGTYAHGQQVFPVCLICLSLMVPLLLLMPAKAAVPAVKSAQERARARTGRILHIWIALFLLVAMNAATYPLYFLFGLDIGLRAEQVNHAIVMSIGASILGSLLASIIGSRFGRRTPFTVGLAVAAVGIVLTVYGRSAAMFLVGINLIMVSSYFVVPYFSGLAATQDRSGRGVALVGTAPPVAYSIGAACSGFLWDFVGKSGIALIALVSVFSSLLLLHSILKTDARRGDSLSRVSP